MNEITYQFVARLAESINLSQDIIRVELAVEGYLTNIGAKKYIITVYGNLGAPKFVTSHLSSVHAFLMGIKEVIRNIQQTPTEVTSESQQSFY